MKYEDQYKRYTTLLENRLIAECDRVFATDSAVGQAARYSLLGGGKRVRGVLTLAFCEMLGGDLKAAAGFGAAVEMLHCYSLIHDDLPCMDNADMRRGKQSCHKKFGESTALLAGDALLTAAFDVLCAVELQPVQQVKAVSCLAGAAGGEGMVFGQELDLAFEGKQPTENELTRLHSYKTGALIRAAGMLGVLASVDTPRDEQECEAYTRTIGVVFQIVDDVLDMVGTTQQLGKPAGEDALAGKVTFATLKGPEAAMQQAQRLTQEACERLSLVYGERADFLVQLATLLVARSS